MLSSFKGQVIIYHLKSIFASIFYKELLLIVIVILFLFYVNPNLWISKLVYITYIYLIQYFFIILKILSC